ncbi:MAG: hypothetical protein FWC16_04525 [Defluviitaleaceae bacterium]|nr:hypothetical protein [Defluviitaleaceae bacterium]MCL2274173.1 hypothetical protein [Defluviitaleaceae bacterium]
MIRMWWGATLNQLYLMRSWGIVAMFALAALMYVGALEAREFATTQIAMSFIIVAVPMSFLGDENSMVSRWNIFERAFSIPPWISVASRYVLFVAISSLLALLWFVLPSYTPEVDNPALLSTAFTWGMAQLFCIFYYPILYAINPKSTGALVIVTLVTMFIAMTAWMFIVLISISIWLFVAIIIVLYMISAGITIALNNFHRGRVF